jgi:hypothetical protein
VEISWMQRIAGTAALHVLDDDDDYYYFDDDYDDDDDDMIINIGSFKD